MVAEQLVAGALEQHHRRLAVGVGTHRLLEDAQVVGLGQHPPVPVDGDAGVERGEQPGQPPGQRPGPPEGMEHPHE